MAHLYILENEVGRHYIGITNVGLFNRLNRHNKGLVNSTKYGKPWRLIYSELYKTMSEARTREIQIKSWKGGNAFKMLLFKAAGSSNGRIHDSESCYLGSNPSPAALKRSDLK